MVVSVFSGLPFLAGEQDAVQEPVIKEYGGFWYAHMDFDGPYSLIAPRSRVFKKEFDQQGLTAAGPFLAVFYNSPREYQKEELKWGLGFPIYKNAQVKPPLKKTEFKKTACVVLVHTGPLNRVPESNDKVKDFVDSNGYQMVWPGYELLYQDPVKVEIVNPVVKK
jgi:effector-binding domain-containing protein